MKIYRHGDVLIAPVESIPDGCRKRSDLILARGEATGHAHRVESNGLVELFDHGDELFLRIQGSPGRVVHEEHRPIELAPGAYRVWRQRQYDPLLDSQIIED